MGRHQLTKISLGAVGCPVWERFVKFVGVQEDVFCVKLPLPNLLAHPEQERLKVLKEFCGGFIENRKNHLWHRPTMHLAKKNQMSIAMSLFLHRKVLPSAKPDLYAYVKKMGERSDDCDPAFLAYVRKEVPRLFRPGWDRGLYENKALNSILPTSSCRGSNRASGGCRMLGLTQGSDSWNDRESFVEHVLTATSCRRLRASQVLSVETGGKYRIVSKSDLGMNSLRPLHASIYDHLSKFSWLLRGDAKAARFSSFTRREGEVFVSGDYESATDNLNSTIQREILSGILDNASNVPMGIKDRAMESMNLMLQCEGYKDVRQERGQLMGNLLSFPLLCVVNYLAFRWVAGRDCPVKVNGDDIVFRSKPEVADRWMESVSRAGLTLSRGKTMVDKSFFSLNSRLFLAGFKKVSLVPCVRSTAFFGFRESLSSLPGRFRAFSEGFGNRRRDTLRVAFLKENRRWIDRTHRSVTRGLGLSVGYGILVRSGLWDREAWYLSFEKEEPMPVVTPWLRQDSHPVGWEFRTVSRMTKELRQQQREVGPLMVELAWSEPRIAGIDEMKFGDQVSDGCPNWFAFRDRRTRDLKARTRLLGLSVQNTRRFLAPRFTEELQRRAGLFRMRKFTVLTPVKQDTMRPLEFSSSFGSKMECLALKHQPRHCPPIEGSDVIDKPELRLKVGDVRLGIDYHCATMSNGQAVKIDARGKGALFGPPIF